MSVPIIADLHLTAGSLPQARLVRPLVRAAVFSCGTVLFLAAIVLWSRRATGAISTPLPVSALLAVGLVVAATAMAARFVWKQTAPTRGSTLAVFFFLTLSALAFTAAASLPGSAPIGLVGLWLVVVGEELWAWWPRRTVASTPVETTSSPPPQQVPVTDNRQRFEQAVADSSLGTDVAQEHVTQQLTRLVESDGTERVVGWMRVSFAAGQRLASVHLAFCPPFARAPEASLERLEGPQVRIKRIQAFPYGARFDLKLGEPAEHATDVLLHVAAEVPGEVADSAAEASD